MFIELVTRLFEAGNMLLLNFANVFDNIFPGFESVVASFVEMLSV